MRTLRPTTGLLGALVWAALCGSLEAQGTFYHEVRVVADDIAASVDWYTEVLDFDVIYYRHIEGARWEARLSRGGLDLFLDQRESVSEPGPSSVIKVAYVVSDLAALNERIDFADPESKVVERSALPAIGVAGWPSEHLLVRDPDGTLIQVFAGAEPHAARPRWFLAAVSVEALEAGVEWFVAAGFEEVYRPDGGDPRALLRRGHFFLEVGEFGPVPVAPSYGVSRLGLDARLYPCTELAPPSGFELRLCGVDRGLRGGTF